MMVYNVAYKMGKQTFTAQLALEFTGRAQEALEIHHHYNIDFPKGRKKINIISIKASVSELVQGTH